MTQSNCHVFYLYFSILIRSTSFFIQWLSIAIIWCNDFIHLMLIKIVIITYKSFVWRITAIVIPIRQVHIIVKRSAMLVIDHVSCGDAVSEMDALHCIYLNHYYDSKQNRDRITTQERRKPLSYIIVLLKL